jgi:NAD-dependent dihydropyrimidine dehydrogenase PreA subunit
MPEWHSDDIDVTIKIDHDKCAAHEECVNVCPTAVYELVDGKAVAEAIDECIECCACEDVCPEDALWNSACD